MTQCMKWLSESRKMWRCLPEWTVRGIPQPKHYKQSVISELYRIFPTDALKDMSFEQFEKMKHWKSTVLCSKRHTCQTKLEKCKMCVCKFFSAEFHGELILSKQEKFSTTLIQFFSTWFDVEVLRLWLWKDPCMTAYYSRVFRNALVANIQEKQVASDCSGTSWSCLIFQTMLKITESIFLGSYVIIQGFEASNLIDIKLGRPEEFIWTKAASQEGMTTIL